MCGFGVSQKAPLELDFRKMGSPTLTPTAPLTPSPQPHTPHINTPLHIYSHPLKQHLHTQLTPLGRLEDGGGEYMGVGFSLRVRGLLNQQAAGTSSSGRAFPWAVPQAFLCPQLACLLGLGAPYTPRVLRRLSGWCFSA